MNQKESVEALKGLLALAAALAAEFKDGVQTQDIAVIIAKLTSEPLKSKLIDAYNGIDKVPSEISSISTMDVIRALPEIVTEIEALLVALKK